MLAISSGRGRHRCLTSETRFYPTRTTPGHEQEKYSFTSGVVVPSGYKIAFNPNPMPAGTFAVGAGVILGYYVQ